MVDIEPTWRVLVVEDEALLAEETCERLKQMMYEVVGIADTGEKAVALAEQHKPDLVLMDIRLKGAISGIEAANEIYERWGVPVIFTSAHSDRDTLRRAQTPAQFGYIVKPLRANDLSTAIRLAMHRFHAEKSMQTTRLTYGAILSSITEGVVVTDAEGAIRFMNYRAEELLEWHIADAFGQPVGDIVTLFDEVSREPAGIFGSPTSMEAVIAGGAPYLLVNRRGREANVDVLVARVHDNISKDDVGMAILLRDITERKYKDDLIWRQAHYDELTELPNRSLLRDQMRQEMRRVREANAQLALLLLDLDHFKVINNTHGHDKGDELLREVGRRIQDKLPPGSVLATSGGTLRVGPIQASLPPDSVLARLGADEFAIALSNVSSAQAAAQVAESIMEGLKQPFLVGEGRFHVGASIGIAMYPDDAQIFEELLRHAELAMYAAKADGRQCHRFYDTAMREGLEDKLSLIGDLRQALARSEFQVHYQPIVDFASRKTVKAEALLRWKHPTRGMVSPALFIPLAEEAGLIHEIGAWVFEQAAQTARRLQSQGKALQISVNVSALQFGSPSFDPKDWVARLAELGLAPGSIGIEITESVLVDKPAQVRARLTEFRDNGIPVSLDDFGTGFSSLSYLQEFNIDYLKVDASFIRGLATEESRKALTEAIIVMAHKLGLKTIAEGVETEEQAGILKAFGCDYAQGYLYSRPVPEQELAV